MRRRSKGPGRRHSFEANRRHAEEEERFAASWREEEAELVAPAEEGQETQRVQLVGEDRPGSREAPSSPIASDPDQRPKEVIEATGYEQIYRVVGHWGWPPSPLFWALSFSLLVHLSMVTLFSIVILFPRQDLEYYRFSIVPDALALPTQEAAPDQLHLSSSEQDLSDLLEKKTPAPLTAVRPQVELPTLEFAELQRLRVRQEHLAQEPYYEELFNEGPRDSWERFGQGLQRFGKSLYGETEDAFGSVAPHRPSAPSHIPAEGYEAYIEWHAKPRQRSLLFAPPVKALRDFKASELKRPIELVLTVNAHGRVVNVWSPLLDETGLIDKVQLAVLKYRFEPLQVDEAGQQMATLRIEATGGGAGL